MTARQSRLHEDGGSAVARQFGVFTIRPDGLSDKKAFQYEASMLGMFRALDSIKSGHALLEGFRAITREVLVFPYDGNLGQCNAYATSDWGMYRNKVSFSPDTWFAHTSCASGGPAGNTAHEILVHELVHALRFSGKTMNRRATDDQEEEIAILVTNVFSSETNRPLRWRHADFAKLPSNDPVTFYANNLPVIRMFCTEHPTVSLDLARIETPFNPLREYYDREV